MMNLNLLKIFVKVAEVGSLTKASKALGHPKSKISRDLTKLEEELQSNLLSRYPRGIVLTDKGIQLWQEAKESLDNLNHLAGRIKDDRNAITGSIRISAPEDLSYDIMHKLILEFTDIYPDVTIDLISTNAFLDFKEHHIDLAFRIGKMADSTLIQKRVCDICLIHVASPQYLKLHKAPTSLAELSNHNFLAFKRPDGKSIDHSVPLKIILSANSFPVLLNFAKADKGITAAPEFLCREDIKSNTLSRVLPHDVLSPRSLYILSNPSQYVPKHVKKFKEHMLERLQKILKLG